MRIQHLPADGVDENGAVGLHGRQLQWFQALRLWGCVRRRRRSGQCAVHCYGGLRKCLWNHTRCCSTGGGLGNNGSAKASEDGARDQAAKNPAFIVCACTRQKIQ